MMGIQPDMILPMTFMIISEIFGQTRYKIGRGSLQQINRNVQKHSHGYGHQVRC